MNLQYVTVLRAALLIIVVNVISMAYSQRRIKGGKVINVEEAKGYMVYLTKAAASTKKYDAWICGGAIVSPKFIVTSAACVEDVRYMYAIAGYTKYVHHDQLTEDKCTKQVMRKIVRYCVPKAYTFEYENIETWANIDIAVAEVDKPYNFKAQPLRGCTHKFSPININYHKNFQKTGTNCLVMGWGHSRAMRRPGDKTNLNEKLLRYASTSIINKTRCIETFEQLSKQMSDVVEKYMLCSDGNGIFNANGEMVQDPDVIVEKDGCDQVDLNDPLDLNNPTNYSCVSKFLRAGNLTIPDKESLRERRNGICQNDHGGPLVTWVGSQEFLIGVASVFNLGENAECRGPYLYTSTYCNSGFLRCVLRNENFAYNYYMRTAEPVPILDILDQQIAREKSEPVMPRFASGTTLADDDLDIFKYLRSDIDDYCNRPAMERGFEIIDQKVEWNDNVEGGNVGENVGSPAVKDQLKSDVPNPKPAAPVMTSRIPLPPPQRMHPTTPWLPSWTQRMPMTIYPQFVYTTNRFSYRTQFYQMRPQRPLYSTRFKFD